MRCFIEEVINMDYFIEGIQGAGKSTLVNRLAEKLPQYQVFREGDYNPVELAWCTYMNKEQYDSVLQKYAPIADEIKTNTHTEQDKRIVTYTRIITDIPGFHKDLEQYEIYNGRVSREEFEKIILSRYAAWNGTEQIFECSIFQNIIESQILYYEMSDEEIIAFYRRLAEVLEDKSFRIVYLEVEDIAESINVIRKERVDHDGNEMWFPLMMAYIEECPWSKKHNIKGFDGLIAHLEHRKKLELQILKEIFPEQSVILQSKQYDIENIVIGDGSK